MNFDAALEAHADWRMKFRLAIAARAQMDEAVIGADHACALGQWLHGEGRQTHGALSQYDDCVRRHTQFHREAGKVAAAINRGNYAIAALMIGDDTDYGRASRDVGAAIMALKRDSSR